MKWVFALNEKSVNFDSYVDQIKVAVASAPIRSELQPIMLYDGTPNKSIAFIQQMGVEIIYIGSFLKHEIERTAEELEDPSILSTGAGAFLRCELPKLSYDLSWPDTRILYTDCDVMFSNHFRVEELPKPEKYIAVAPEDDINDFDNFNSGVMVMHLPSLREIDDDFRSQLRSELIESMRTGWDQYTYRRYFKGKAKKLDPLYNWKPYWGRNEEAKIIHFHGPKPWIRKEIANGWAPKVLRDLATDYFWELSDVWEKKLSEVNKGLNNFQQ